MLTTVLKPAKTLASAVSTRCALRWKAAGVEFIAGNGGGAGVSLKKTYAPAIQLPDGEAGIIENSEM